MVSTALAATLGRRNVHYGWVVVGATFFTMLVTAAAMGAPGVLIVPLEKEFGWTTSEISAALAVRLILYGLLGPFAAAFMNRFGVRRVVVFAMALIATGFLTSTMMTQLWQLMLLWGLVIGVGTGLTAMVLAATVSTRWFNHRRGLVMGMLAASAATGQLAFLPVIAAFTERYGWRTALVFVCGLSTNGLIQTHFVSLCNDYGMAAVTAAGVLAMMGMFDFVGTIGSGWLSDRYDCRWLLFWYYGLRGLSLLYLPFTTFTFYGLSLFAVFYGLDWIATVPPTVKLVADRFGREKAGLVFGWVFAGHQLGAATAAYGAGFTRTEYLTYLPAFIVAGAACIVAALLVLSIGRSWTSGRMQEAAPARA